LKVEGGEFLLKAVIQQPRVWPLVVVVVAAVVIIAVVVVVVAVVAVVVVIGVVAVAVVVVEGGNSCSCPGHAQQGLVSQLSAWICCMLWIS
jgi:hypothetical protein